ncbi:MAG: AAA family ATPase [Gammaproteobacteria bacterium]|nr:AAA family ATPase [Gammaproteobacteria bacterium]MBU1553536.1 AAA family ATPase [Gammaproteobacteria bacterium]MBU2071655.1 AAA family ATPase [Gammaproteobacteria bacterium]MBU2204011.1 AAA family ATPase [Gammaproteobacteria bacterium]
MQIKSITIQNFKGIRRKAVIPLAPVTMLFGANSSGKSSILHALIYLFELIVNRNPDPEYSTVTGEHLYLGGFKELVFGKDINNTITLGLDLDTSDDLDVFDEFISEVERNLVEDNTGWYPDSQTDNPSFELDIKWNNLDNKAYVSEYRSFVNGKPFMTLQVEKGQKSVSASYIDVSHWPVADIFTNLAETVKAGMWGLIPLHSGQTALPDSSTRLKLDHVPWEWSAFFEDHPLAAKVFAEASLSQGLLGPLRLLQKKLASLIHIGPLRVVPNRSFVAKKVPEKSRWYDGEAGWDGFYNGSKTLQQQVNEWYQLHFKCNYQFLNAPKGYGVALTETQNSHALLPSQVGAGISQVFPFVVAAMKSDIGIVSIEQPELHLHPAWQVELAELLLLQTSDLSVTKQFFIETHSEHMILRLLRRVRESKIRPDNLSIIYMNIREDGIEPVKLDVTTDGDFAEDWPNGFFDERDEELF